MSKNIFLLYGEDTYSLEMYIKKIKKEFDNSLQLGINLIMLDENGISNIISECSTPAFGYDKKLIIVNNSNLFKKSIKSSNEVLRDKLISYLQEEFPKDEVTLIFNEQDVAKMKMYKALEKVGNIIEFKTQTEDQIKTKLKQIINAYGVKISSSNLEYLLLICGTDLQSLINEVRKLIEYKGKRK